MSQAMWISITDLGDSAVGLTLAALVLVALFASGWRRGAVAWLVTVAGCGAATAALKLAFGAAPQACGTAAATAAFSPSGHAALSTAVYGGLAVLGTRQVSPGVRLVIGIAAAILVVLIAASRVAIEAHTPVEVAAGLGVGLAAVVLLIELLGRQTGPERMLPQFAVVSVLALVWMYGTHWPVEEGIHRLAAWLHHSSSACSH